MNKKQQNISCVVSQHLCNTCGACQGICPVSAIEFNETTGGNLFPRVIHEKCLDCGLCLKVCPGGGFCDRLLESLTDKGDPFKGTAIKTFLGKGTDEKIYKNSQSGGVVSSLLLSLMRGKKIQGAVVVSMEAGMPPRPAVSMATTEKEILNAQKSKYCPVPLLSVIETLKKVNSPVALVGLPCHMHGLYNVFDVFPELKEIVRYRIGLICAGTMVYTAMDYFFRKLKQKPHRDWLLMFRDKTSGGYPGNIKILSDGKPYVLSNKNRLAVRDYFVPACCRICFDKMNILSDITASDPWGIEYADRENGESVCIARNNKGLEIINQAMQDKMVSLREIDYNEVIEGQNIHRKKGEWKGYMEAWIKTENITPNYYNFINSYTNKVGKDSYKKKLNYSLSLDYHLSKDLLMNYVDKQLLKKKIFQKLLLPLRTARKILKYSQQKYLSIRQ